MAEINKVYEVRGALNAHDRMAKGCSDDTDVLVTTTCKCINQVESILALCEGEIVKDPKWETYVIALSESFSCTQPLTGTLMRGPNDHLVAHRPLRFGRCS